MLHTKGRIPWLVAIMVFAAVEGGTALAGTATTDQAKASEANPARTLVKPPPGFTAACGKYAWLCEGAPKTETTRAPSDVLDLARSINRRVNRTVTHISDRENYGRADHWTLPGWRGGDCEDYVLEKYKRLLEAGVDSRNLSIAIVRHRAQNHAVLMLRQEHDYLVLDSLTMEILPWRETGYRYLAMQARDDQSAWSVIDHQPKSGILAAKD